MFSLRGPAFNRLAMGLPVIFYSLAIVTTFYTFYFKNVARTFVVDDIAPLFLYLLSLCFSYLFLNHPSSFPDLIELFDILEYDMSTMKIERINDNQIRCTLSHDDLTARNMNITELAYGTEKAKNLFLEMMQRASNEVGFDADGESIMIEAIPNKDQGIVLVITKVEDPEEVDARFARFSPMPGASRNPLEELLSMINEGLPGMLNPQQLTENNDSTRKSFIFDSLDEATDAVKCLAGDFSGKSSLYKNPTTKKYHLYIDDVGTDPVMYASTCNVLSEHCKVAYHNKTGTSYLDEHYETIIKDNAIEALSIL